MNRSNSSDGEIQSLPNTDDRLLHDLFIQVSAPDTTRRCGTDDVEGLAVLLPPRDNRELGRLLLEDREQSGFDLKDETDEKPNKQDEAQATANKRMRERLGNAMNEPESKRRQLEPSFTTVGGELYMRGSCLDGKRWEDLTEWQRFYVETNRRGFEVKDRDKRVKVVLGPFVHMEFFERLHEEVVGLLGWVEPTTMEMSLRKLALARVIYVAKKLWPKASFNTFGSVASGLVLPCGDIDLVISKITIPEPAALDLLLGHLKTWNILRNSEVIYGAKVPIIKGLDSVTDYPLDITINQESSMTTTNHLKENCQKHPLLRPLILIIKIYLNQRNLSETFHGGVGSYLCFCMCLAFLQQHESTYSFRNARKMNFGLLLYDFFQFYGYDLKVSTLGLSVRNGGSVYTKESRNFYNAKRPYLLSIESPLDHVTDVGKNAYGFPYVRQAFRITHARLVYLGKKYSDSGLAATESILAAIIPPNDAVFLRRPPYRLVRKALMEYAEDRPSREKWLENPIQCDEEPTYASRVLHQSSARPQMRINDDLLGEIGRQFTEAIPKMAETLKELANFVNPPAEFLLGNRLMPRAKGRGKVGFRR